MSLPKDTSQRSLFDVDALVGHLFSRGEFRQFMLLRDSVFPNIEKWSYIEHAPGAYPFQAGAKLWRAGLVPSYDGKKWRLHAGPALEVVWSDEKEK